MTAPSDPVHAATVRLAHDIARQFAHRPHDEAVEEVSAHILKFWEPRMRTELRRCVAAGDHGIDPLVHEAIGTWPDEQDTQADRREPSGG